MAELKTKATDASVLGFLSGIADERKRKDATTIVEMLKQATSSEPRMWGDSIVGFGDVHLRYASGRELDWFRMGFSPRKQEMVVYGLGGFDGFDDLLARLGKFRRGKGCLYIKRLADVNETALREMMARSAARD